MKTVYTQDDAQDLKRTGAAHREKALVYVTPISNGASVEVDGASSVPGDTIAVASDGDHVWPLNAALLDKLQKAKRPQAPKGAVPGGGQIQKKK